MASSWTIKCKRCSFCRYDIKLKSDADRHATAHGGLAGHEVITEEVKPLGNKVRVGDKIKIREDRALALEGDCARAGWAIDRREVRTVQRIDEFGPGGSVRLFVEGPPFAFNPRDVQLAWNSDKERREALGL